jgi:hypothetical protein
MLAKGPARFAFRAFLLCAPEKYFAIAQCTPLSGKLGETGLRQGSSR